MTLWNLNYVSKEGEKDFKEFANSEKQFANDTKEFANSEKQFANDIKEFVNSEKQFANDTKFRKEFVKAQRVIYKLISSNPKVTTAQIAEKLNVSIRQVQKYLKRLVELGLIIKEGSRKNGSWKILDKEYEDFFKRI